MEETLAVSIEGCVESGGGRLESEPTRSRADPVFPREIGGAVRGGFRDCCPGQVHEFLENMESRIFRNNHRPPS